MQNPMLFVLTLGVLTLTGCAGGPEKPLASAELPPVKLAGDYYNQNSVDRAPQLVSQAHPIYPSNERRAGVSGSVHPLCVDLKLLNPCCREDARED